MPMELAENGLHSDQNLPKSNRALAHPYVVSCLRMCPPKQTPSPFAVLDTTVTVHMMML